MGHIVIPYVQGLGESIKCTCNKYGIQTHFRGNRTLEQILVMCKDKDPKEKKSAVIYCYQCAAMDCGRSTSEKHLGPWGGEVQGTPKGTLPYPSAQPTYRTPTQPGQLQHNRQGGPGPYKIN